MKRWVAGALLVSSVGAAHDAGHGTAKYNAGIQSHYLLGCGGCHGVDGISNSNLVPDLRNQVGYYLAIPEGRAFLVRLPNVAFYTASNDELTAILNFVVFKIGGNSAPPGALPYTADEVAEYRKHPLNEVSLLDYRSRLVDELIKDHHASDHLRIYGVSAYQDIGGAPLPP